MRFKLTRSRVRETGVADSLKRAFARAFSPYPSGPATSDSRYTDTDAPPSRFFDLTDVLVENLVPSDGLDFGTLFVIRPTSLEDMRERFPGYPAGGRIEHWAEVQVVVGDEGIVIVTPPVSDEGQGRAAAFRAEVEVLQDHLAHWASEAFGKRFDPSFFPGLVFCVSEEARDCPAWSEGCPPATLFWSSVPDVADVLGALLARSAERRWPVPRSEVVALARKQMLPPPDVVTWLPSALRRNAARGK